MKLATKRKEPLFYASLGVLLCLLLVRLITMDVIPLNDSTEARYAEIARIMVETGDWITPMHRYGEPFWAKPPLSMWLSAVMMRAFGVSALTARLPGFFCSCGVLWLIWGVAKHQHGKTMAMNAVLILAGSFYFLLNAGTVMTEPVLVLCLTLSMVSFWHALQGTTHRRWGYLFFVGLGFGLLAKGPIACVLLGIPLFFWVVWQKAWRRLWHQLPWLTGGALLLLIAVPWYVLAELKTPGFLNYFLVGEHLMRFVQPGWAGDKYGYAHVAPYGMIWVYLLLGTLPWGVCAVMKWRAIPSLWRGMDAWMGYLLLCGLMPLVFFTFARNIIYPYVFPSLPALALLGAECVHQRGGIDAAQRVILKLASVTAAAFLLVACVCAWKPELITKSHNRVIDYVQTIMKLPASALVYWGYRLEYSAQFYSHGQALATLDLQRLCDVFSDHQTHVLVHDSTVLTPLPESVLSQLTWIHEMSLLKRKLTLYRVSDFTCPL